MNCMNVYLFTCVLYRRSSVEQQKYWRHHHFLCGMGTHKSVCKINGPGSKARFSFFGLEVCNLIQLSIIQDVILSVSQRWWMPIMYTCTLVFPLLSSMQLDSMLLIFLKALLIIIKLLIFIIMTIFILLFWVTEFSCNYNLSL